MRICTCVGHCYGPRGLGVGWICALQAQDQLPLKRETAIDLLQSFCTGDAQEQRETFEALKRLQEENQKLIDDSWVKELRQQLAAERKDKESWLTSYQAKFREFEQRIRELDVLQESRRIAYDNCLADLDNVKSLLAAVEHIVRNDNLFLADKIRDFLK